MRDVEAAREAEAQRERRRYANDDERLVWLFLDNVRGPEDGEDLIAVEARAKQAKAMERIQARLRRESGGLTFTSLVVLMLNEAATSRGWR